MALQQEQAAASESMMSASGTGATTGSATRNYSFKDVDMLIAAKTLSENFTAHKAAITAVRPTWVDPFIGNFQKKIDTAISTHLGLNPKKNLKLSTQAVSSLQAQAKKDLSLFKVQVEADYSANKTRRNWILDTLGFTEHFKAVQKNDQEALIELLYTFKQNMDKALKTELMGKGISAALIDGISAHADKLKSANVTQETFKGSTKEITAAAIKEFNAIYEQAISISKIAAKVLKDNKTIAPKFSFSKLVSAANRPKGGTGTEPEPLNPTDPLRPTA